MEGIADDPLSAAFQYMFPPILEITQHHDDYPLRAKIVLEDSLNKQRKARGLYRRAAPRKFPRPERKEKLVTLRQREMTMSVLIDNGQRQTLSIDPNNCGISVICPGLEGDN
eukprot:scaffold9370_cov152-Skeletonema_marinoi.AAC.7